MYVTSKRIRVSGPVPTSSRVFFCCESLHRATKGYLIPNRCHIIQIEQSSRNRTALSPVTVEHGESFADRGQLR